MTAFINEHFTPITITATNPVNVTIIDHGFSPGYRIRATDFVKMPMAVATGMEQLNNRLFSVQNVTTNTFDLYDIFGNAVDGTNYTAFTGIGDPQFTLTGPDLNVENGSS